ncbi:EAL domain-containing protein [Massilia soli]|uniref:EAL domain-containing protein n=1 Tax=Massilia soli TaxID=2792854 RepID=A0ABS7SSF2_9BURK|nr:EAL domain-containing protein [Massilia soli]MBZ2208862.1 EAL domain-containing protein [Massilia soli]
MNGAILIDPALAGARPVLRQLNPAATEFCDGYRMLVELVPEAIWINCGGQVVYANPAARRLFGAADPGPLIGSDALARVPPESRHQLAQYFLTDADCRQQPPRCPLQLRRIDGALVDVEYFGCAVRFNNRESVLNVAHDVTARREHEQAIEHQATHDLLTGLPNRALFLDRLALAIRRAERHRGRVAVMFVDLDKFKHVNDTLGHAAGDQLLRTVGARLAQCVRDADTVARLGGDEFVLLLDHPLGEHTPALVAERVARCLGEPVSLGGHEHVVTGSIGISIHPDDGAEAEELLRQADIAMYRAKEGGRNGFQFFTHDMQCRLDARMMLEQGLHRALQRDEFVLHYQPQVDLRSGRIVGVEALLRWQSPELGLVQPFQFIPVAEESNLISQIGQWVLDKACTTLRSWLDAGVPVVPIAVNVAASQFSDLAMDQVVRATLARHGVAPHLLELELTESLSMEDPEASVALMHRLKATGISMSIDDFGTGYSNLAYLKRFPVDKLKIDQSFTRGLTCEPEDRAIVTAVIRMAHSLGLRAIAEGVETEGQLRVLAEQGCDEVQGFYFSRALSGAAMVAMLGQQAAIGPALPMPGLGLRTVLLADPDPRLRDDFRAIAASAGYHVLLAQGFEEAYELLAGNEVGVVVAGQERAGDAAIDFFRRLRHIHPRVVRVLLTGDTSATNLADAINSGSVYKFATKPWSPSALTGTLASAYAYYERF